MPRPRFPLLVLLAVVVAAAAATYAFVMVDGSDDPTDGAVTGPTALREARDALLAAPQQVDVVLAVDVASSRGNEELRRQEIVAAGAVDYEARDAQIVYDFQGIRSSGGVLGDLDVMEVLYDDGMAYLDIFKSGKRWMSIEPENASNQHLLRLREVMLTSPMILPGLLEVAASSGAESDTGHEVDVVFLVEADDDIVAGIGEALDDMAAEDVNVAVTLDAESPSRIALSFTYPGRGGPTKVDAAYEISPSARQVSVETPSGVRKFSDVLGTQ